jgi:hypothetical protein
VRVRVEVSVAPFRASPALPCDCTVRTRAYTLRVAMGEDLKKLIEAVRNQPPMTDRQREEQIRNFAAGNIGLENPRVTRQVVDEAIRRRPL